MHPDSRVLWAVAIAIAVVVWLLRSRRQRGFKDWLKNPRTFDPGFVGPDEIEALATKARTLDHEALRNVVHQYVWKGREKEAGERVLRAVGRRIHPFVLEVLGEKSTHAKLTRISKKDWRSASPFERACKLLEGPPACADAVPLLAPFLEHATADIRKSAVYVICSSGAPAIAPLVRKALVDVDQYVRSYALMGLERAQGAGLPVAALFRELAPDLKLLVANGESAEAATKLLFHSDPDAARAFLLQEKQLHPEAAGLKGTLKSLADLHIAVPRDRLLSLVVGLEARDMTYPVNYAIKEALRLLAHHRAADDETFLRARLTHPDKIVAEGAAAAMIIWIGLPDLHRKLWEAFGRRPLTEVPEYPRHYLAVSSFDGEVNNGGISQYFFNSSGDNWPEALAALEALGFVERRRILREAVRRFGPIEPPRDWEWRQDQLADVIRKNDDAFSDLDTSYYACKENVDVHLAQYVFAHAEEFRRALNAPGSDT